MISEILQRIKNENIKNGTPLEIILFKGATYDDGRSGSGWTDTEKLRGYYYLFNSDIPEQQNIEVLGYFIKIDEEGIFLNDHLGELYLNERVIQSYTKLKKEEYF